LYMLPQHRPPQEYRWSALFAKVCVVGARVAAGCEIKLPVFVDCGRGDVWRATGASLDGR
jgi:hypothetical protein